MLTHSRRVRVVVVALVAIFAASACLPEAPAAGRNTPIRRVLVIADSLGNGFFMTTPAATAALERRLAPEGASIRLVGSPGGNPLAPWPGFATWIDQMRFAVTHYDPDVVIVQTTLFPDQAEPGRQQAYRSAIDQLFDAAQSRGAHTYIVAHHRSPDPATSAGANVAERIQAEAASGRGISTIPLTWWLERCATDPYIADRFHLNAAGVECYADALNAAVNQLRNR